MSITFLRRMFNVRISVIILGIEIEISVQRWTDKPWLQGPGPVPIRLGSGMYVGMMRKYLKNRFDIR